jgi:hypothetical protein
MSASSAVQVTTDATVKSWKYTVTAPDGGEAVSGLCWSSPINDDERVAYRGNGTYTLTIQTYTATGCSTGARPPMVYTWNVAASVAVGQPPGPLMTRPANTSVTNTHLIDFSGNPGAQNYEIRFAKGGVTAPEFRTLGKAKVNSKGVFKLRFRLARGTYRMRYSFKGTSTVARGTVYQVIRVRRILG